MEYDWQVKDLRPKGKESPEFYKYNDPYVLSVTGYGRTVWIRVDGEMRLYTEDGESRLTNAAELEAAGVTNEEQLGDCHYDMNPWFDAYEEDGDEEEHLDMVTHSLSEIILEVQNHIRNEDKRTV